MQLCNFQSESMHEREQAANAMQRLVRRGSTALDDIFPRVQTILDVSSAARCMRSRMAL